MRTFLNIILACVTLFALMVTVTCSVCYWCLPVTIIGATLLAANNKKQLAKYLS